MMDRALGGNNIELFDRERQWFEIAAPLQLDMSAVTLGQCARHGKRRVGKIKAVARPIGKTLRRADQ